MFSWCAVLRCAVQLEDVDVSGADYIKPLLVGNFRGLWEELDPATEREDDYGLGARDNLQVRAANTGPEVWY